MDSPTRKRSIGVALSVWEFAALATGRIPPLTDLLRRHPALGAMATGWVAWHLLSEKPVMKVLGR